MNERTEQIKAVMADEAFVNACVEAENEEAVQKLFADKGIEMSLGEIEILKETIGALADGKITEEQLDKFANGGELSEEELENAAGGEFFFNYFLNGEKTSGALYAFEKAQAGLGKFDGSKTLAAGGYATIAVGALVVGGAIAQACGVDVVGGVKSGYEWCKDKITSRW
ncbi:MAG: hypothetical protein IKN55_03775 [Oscillospiraceae bacterium]|nr:hypothetical protein [Oscillospiraceae bacterium]